MLIVQIKFTNGAFVMELTSLGSCRAPTVGAFLPHDDDILPVVVRTYGLAQKSAYGNTKYYTAPKHHLSVVVNLVVLFHYVSDEGGGHY
jgi:hypothetical protein